MSPACTPPSPDSAAETGANILQPEPKSPWPKVVNWCAWIVLAGYLFLLLFRARWRQNIVPTGNEITLTDLLALRQWLYEALSANLQMALCLLLFGFLVAMGFACGQSQKAVRLIGRWILMGLLGSVTFLFLFLIENGRFPGFLSSLLPLTGFVFGAWLGRSVLRGPRAVLWLVPKMLGLLLAGTVVLATLGFLGTARSSLAIQSPKVTSAEKRRLVETLRNPQPLPDGTRRLSFSEHDLNLILAMGIPQVLPNACGRIRLEDGAVTAELSVPLTDSKEPMRFVNVQASGTATIKAGKLEIDFEQVHIGRVPIPGFILDRLVRQGIALVANDRDLSDVLSAIGSFRVTGDGVEAVIVSRGLLEKVMPSLMSRFGQSPNVVVKTRVYYEYLAKPYPGVADDDRFAAMMQSAFALARARSKTGDPALENRAAILALAILLGHRRIEHLVGSVTDEELLRQSRRHVRFVKLRGRADWSRHFLVSAALALVSNESLSDEAGLFKEELDAGEGGSGFSFSDLVADRAGTLFALAATGDEKAARRLQDLLADGFDLGAIFPEAADLPEGISDARLESEYGGVGGEKYQKMIAEIERRLGECEGLRQAGE